MNMKGQTKEKRRLRHAIKWAKRSAFFSSFSVIAPARVRGLICSNEQESFDYAGLCGECKGKITPIIGRACEKCGRPLIAEESYCETCREHERHFDRAFSCFVYEGAARMMITRFKYAKEPFYARQMAEDMAELYYAKGMSCTAIVPSPSSAERIKERGYDHIAVLAELLSKRLHLPVVYNAVVKGKDNKAQAGLKGLEREENVLGVYEKGENARRLKGARVLIVDDVLTTGATASAIAKVAKRAGAKGAYVLTFASTRYYVVPKDDQPRGGEREEI